MKLTKELILAAGFAKDLQPDTLYGYGLHIIPADSGNGYVVLRGTEQHNVVELAELVMFISDHARMSAANGQRAAMTMAILDCLDMKVLKEYTR